MVFTFRELAAVALTGSDNYRLYVRKDGGKWLVEVSVLNQQAERKYVVQTNRGNNKTWRYLEDVLSFLNEYCANCRHLDVTVEGKTWQLRSGEVEAKTE